MLTLHGLTTCYVPQTHLEKLAVKELLKKRYIKLFFFFFFLTPPVITKYKT